MSLEKLSHVFSRALRVIGLAAFFAGMAVGMTGSIANAQLPTAEVANLFSLTWLNQMCEDSCRKVLNEDIDACGVYPPLSNDYTDCVAEALASYYQCKESCPKVPKVLLDWLSVFTAP